MRVREPVISVVLFALAFVGALVVLREPSAADAARALAAARGAPEARAAQMSRDSSAAHSGRQSAPGALGAAAPDGERRRAEASAFAPAEPAAAAAVNERDGTELLAAAAVDARDITEPLVDAVNTLDYSLSPDDRAHAINSLATSMPEGPELARARSSLRVAAADENPDIAARAQEAYDLLVERDDR